MADQKPLEGSPFSKTDFVVFGEHSKSATHLALRTKQGQVLINYNDGTSYAMLKQIAKLTGSAVIQVKGTWTFTPDPIEESPIPKQSNGD